MELQFFYEFTVVSKIMCRAFYVRFWNDDDSIWAQKQIEICFNIKIVLQETDKILIQYG